MKSDISGFPELLPNEQIVFNKIADTIKTHFELYGFIPMDTPAVERVETLLAKGNDNEIYGLYRLADRSSKKDLGLRFDLTVPLARYVASKFGQLVFPHKRYQIAPVWRGERPQFGRYRQFHQCDIDIVGDGELSIAYDAEVIKVITEILEALNLPKFTTKINNRKILSGFLNTIVSEEKLGDLIRIIDKADKISHSEFLESLNEFDINKKNLDKLEIFLDSEKKEVNFEILKWLRSFNFSEEFARGVEELEEVVSILKRFNIEDKNLRISTKLARGLTYYTGNVFETSFDDIKGIGAIAAGGRYDNLVSMMSDKKIPGVGASIGITRLLSNLFDKGLIKCGKSTTTELLVTVQNRSFIESYMKLSDKFRRLGIKTETYLQNKALGYQLSYASKKGIRHVLIANDVELLENKAIIRNLDTKEQTIIRTKYMGKDIVSLLK